MVYRFLLASLVLPVALAAQGPAEARLATARGPRRLELLLESGRACMNRDGGHGLALALEAVQLARQLKDRPGELEALLLQGQFLGAQGEYAEALRIFREAEQEAIRWQAVRGLWRNLLAQVAVLDRLAQYEPALDLEARALQLAQGDADEKGIAEAQYSLGLTFERLKQDARALEAWERCLPVFERLQDKAGLAKVFRNMGVCARHRGDPAGALGYFTRSMRLSEELGDPMPLAQVLNSIAIVHYDLKEYRECEAYYLRALAIEEKSGEPKIIALECQNLADLYRVEGQIPKGRPYLDRARALSERLGAQNVLAECYKTESEYAADLGDMKGALAWCQKWAQAQETLFSQTASEKMAELQARYDMEKKQREIELLRKDQAVRRVSNRLYATALAGMALLGLLLLNRYRLKVRGQKEIARKNRDLETIDAIVRSINRRTGMKELAEDLLEQGQSLIVRADRIGLFLLDHEARTFAAAAVRSCRPEEVEELRAVSLSFEEAVERYTRNGREIEPGVFLIRDFQALPGAESMGRIRNPAAMLVLVLEIDGALEGFLVLDHMTNPEAFNRSDAVNLERFREHAISAVAKARLLAQLGVAKEAAERASAFKSAFIATTSHELRTPLHAILGFLRLLEGGHVREDDRVHYQRTMKGAAESLLQLVNDLLDMSRIEAGALELESVPFAPGDVVEEALDLLSERAREKGLELAWEVEGDVPARLRGDPHRLRQMLVNLVGNALKFTQHGGVRCLVTLREAREGRACLRMAVRDTGEGVSPEQLGRLFQAFTQAESRAKRQGTGLGLSITRQLAELMEGRVGAESVPGSGSTFWFEVWLPVLEAGPEVRSRAGEGGLPAPSEAEEAFALRRGHPRGKILVADDNEANRILVEAMLRQLGVSFDVVADGAQAVRRFGEEAFDLVLLDGNMPEMDGPEALQAIRALPGGDRVPVILFSASAGDAVVSAARNQGFDDFLRKPVEASEFRRVVIQRLKAAGPQAPAPSAAAFDATYLMRLAPLLGGSAELREFADQFQADGETRLARMEMALGAQDRHDLERQAHDLKTNAGNLGLRELSALSAELEHASARAEGPDLARRLEAIRHLFGDSCRQLQAFLETLPGS
jgi:signal transduction histidine kinase/DNA-binding response OmpR family regulator/tetratricopeptide (TPR) repeat protein